MFISSSNSIFLLDKYFSTIPKHIKFELININIPIKKIIDVINNLLSLLLIESSKKTTITNVTIYGNNTVQFINSLTSKLRLLNAFFNMITPIVSVNKWNNNKIIAFLNCIFHKFTLNSNPILLTEIEILAEIIWINNSVYNIDTLNLLVLKYIIIIIDIPIIKYL